MNFYSNETKGEVKSTYAGSNAQTGKVTTSSRYIRHEYHK